MTLLLRVTWPNAGTPLLPDALADVRAEVENKPLPLKSKSLGMREFEIPAGATRVDLKARFSVAFGKVGSVAPMTEEVLRVHQPYSIVDGGTRLEPINIPAYVKGHPLVETTTVANVHGAALARIQTDFVNITPFWEEYAEDWIEYLVDNDKSCELVALGYTGGKPLIWFASIPKACLAPPAPGISTLVFFRPTSYVYGRVDEGHSMYGLNRFLLTPTEDANQLFHKRDVFLRYPTNPDEIHAWLRCGFEDAMTRSRKPVLMLHPWPSGTDFSSATSTALPGLVEKIVRFLWAEQRIAKNLGAIHLGKLGLSGYSAGGLALWWALQQNAPRVNTVFSFDAAGTSASGGAILRWFNENPSRRLFMTGGLQLTANEGIRRGIKLAGGNPDGRFMNVPPDEKAYRPGVNPLWDQVLTELLKEKNSEWVWLEKGLWHQFAMFGGYIALPRPTTVTFLQHFLQESNL